MALKLSDHVLPLFLILSNSLSSSKFHIVTRKLPLSLILSNSLELHLVSQCGKEVITVPDSQQLP